MIALHNWSKKVIFTKVISESTSSRPTVASGHVGGEY